MLVFLIHAVVFSMWSLSAVALLGNFFSLFLGAVTEYSKKVLIHLRKVVDTRGQLPRQLEKSVIGRKQLLRSIALPSNSFVSGTVKSSASIYKV